MKLKTIKTVDAVGQVLCHDVTKIVPGEFKGPLFRKGHVVTKEDIPKLLDIGKDILYVWEDIEGMVHENDAAERLKNLLVGDNIEISSVKEGKINLISKVDGVVKMNTDALYQLNMIDEVIVATKPNFMFLKKGEIIAGTRVIPLMIKEEKILEAEALVKEPIINMLPLKVTKVGMVTTGNEVFYGRIKDKFKEVMEPKIEKYGAKLIGQTIVPDIMEEITKAINDHLENGAELVICTGGMSVDPSDITPNAIMNTGSEIITYGMPILTGSMTLIAYHNDIAIVGFPAGVLFAERSSADVILHRLLCKDKITREEVARYGNGGFL
ncbi:MAG: putative competence-damage inducible protein [Candidatus Izimaplasma bacterium HR2]|nr:MAG: putative competence-damage inducible protein [Candidatus Izimaplasma bacterium HR2]